MRRFLSKRINLLGSITIVFGLLFLLIVHVIPTWISNNNLDELKSHLQHLARNYETITEVDATERIYIYQDGETEILLDAGTIYDIDTDIEVHLILWGYDQSVSEFFYADESPSGNFVYFIRVLDEDHFIIAFADTSELDAFVSNFRLYSVVIVSLLFIATLILSSTYLSKILQKKYSFYDPRSVLNSKIAFIHNYDKKDIRQNQLTYHNVHNIHDIIDKFGYRNSDDVYLLIKQKLLKTFSFDNTYQLSDSEFIISSSSKETAHMDFLDAINCPSEKEDTITYEFKVKTVIVDMEITPLLDGLSLINRIQYALFNSKNEKNDITHVDKALLDSLNEELRYQSKLQDAIKNNKLTNYYQIKVNPNTNIAMGAEALSRWIEGDEVVSPTKYIHLAEASGLIYDIDMISFENTCKSIAILCLNDSLPENFRLSTNFSPLTLKNLSIETIKDVLKKTKADPQKISVEVTESASLEFDKIRSILDELVDLGLHIEIDDFSAGNSSFTVLPLINASTVKLDMAVLPESIESKKEVLIYDSLLSISRQLKMKIISEGVESKDQVDYLTSRKVDGIQGFYYSRPVPLDDFIELLKKYT